MCGSSPDRVGPGAYNEERSRSVDISYAPFGTTKVRDPAGFKLCGADPGAYDPKIPGKYECNLPRKNVAFGIGARRDEPNPLDKNPGPGDYKVDPALPKPQASRTMGEPLRCKKALIYRSSSAPSIPQGHQSYGYEELGDGRLALQGPRDGRNPLTGRLGDSAGPGQYDVHYSSFQTKTGRFLQASRDVNLKDNSVPGPGHYVVNDKIGQVARAPAVQSSFVSQTEKPAPRSKDFPGPGAYVPFRVEQKSLREQNPEMQYFGSTVERFKHSSFSETPGPGSYLAEARRLKPALKPFCSSVDRFKQNAGSNVPGPGEYEPTVESSTSGPTGTVSILGAMGGLAFGSMERRLKPEKAGTFPGPGEYHSMGESRSEPSLKDSSSKSRRVRPLPTTTLKSGVFKDTGMTASKLSASFPAPGAYDPVHRSEVTAVVRLPPKGEGFLSAGDRFAYHDGNAAPGPGNYDPQNVLGGKKKGTFNRTMLEGVPRSGRPGGLGFDSQSKRFESNRKAAFLPGPGHYKTDPSWITPTHNIYFGDVI